jgi:putative ATP-dependent endonuclease of the OLD family
MRIVEVQVSNFRSLRQATLTFDALTVLVGRNGAGKSSFLHALEVFYDVSFPITPDDFFDRDESQPIEIGVRFGGLGERELAEFNAYLDEGTLTVLKRVSAENERFTHRYFAQTLQLPRFALIRRIAGKTERRKAFVDLVASGDVPHLEGKPASAEATEDIMTAYEAEHPEALERTEREEQFFGARNVGGGKLDKYTKFVLVPAVREATDEIGGRTAAAKQLIDTLVMRKVSARPDVQELQSDMSKRVVAVFNPDNLSELSEVGSALSDSLGMFAPGSGLRLAWDDPVVPQFAPPPVRVTLIEDGFDGSIEMKGHGLQRALILTLLRYMALLREEQGTEAGPDLVMAIEEPELHLHPTRCRYLAGILRTLTVPREGEDSPNQVLLTTHSPHFLEIQWFDNIRVARKAVRDLSTAETSVHMYGMHEASQELARICEADPAEFTRESFQARSSPIMTSLVNEGFFAEVAVLVEGASEAGAIWELQEILAANWAELGIALLPVGGKNNLDRPSVVFLGLDVPTYVVFDADNRFLGKSQEQANRKSNRRVLRLVDGPEDDEFPPTEAFATWAVFGDDFESELVSAVGYEKFDEIRVTVAAELGGASTDKFFKNPIATAALIRRIYDQGLAVPILEEIVARVTALAPTA